MAARPWRTRLWIGLEDYARRIWDNSGDDDIFFLASGIAFNLLLALVPFLLLFATALTYLLNQSPEASLAQIVDLVNRFLPLTASEVVTRVVSGIIKARGAVGIYAAIGFIWFSTRLFGSLRSVLAAIFDIEVDRGIIDGKIYDVKITIVSSLLFVLYTGLSAYLAIASTRGVAVLAALGLRQDVMGNLEYTLGRVLAFLFIAAIFFGLYKFLPYKKIRWQTALVASSFTAVMFEIAKVGFGIYVSSFHPGSLYSGTLAALVITFLWIYYAAVVFILGGEVAQVFELRHVRRRQHEAFEE
ncbi:MAG TPA: YihY/virulence factor BrkB family protein, partial [Candidatus Elarobacter sp.]|nr:YihY/virulence factor BrkB family protein [Candidatus Elarobacter sp.]